MNLIQKLNIFTVIITLALCIINYIKQEPFFYSYLLEAIFGIVCIPILYKSNKFNIYKIIATIILCLDCFVIIYFLFIVKTKFHFMEALWIVLISLTSYFILGKKAGSIFLLVNIVIYSIYLNSNFLTTINQETFFSNTSLLLLSIKLTLIMSLIWFIMNRFRKVHQFANERIRQYQGRIKKEKKEIERQNNELTLMLREVHGRVNDDLILIESLIKTQIKNTKKKETKEVLINTKNRIKSMQLAYKKMYAPSKSYSNFHAYLNDLIEIILSNHFPEKEIQKNINVDSLNFKDNELVYLGLIINELITNSLKHGFISTNEEISISLFFLSEDGGSIKFIYSDNGKWKKPERESFGLSLIESLTQQLDGEFTRVVDNLGTHYTFIFNP